LRSKFEKRVARYLDELGVNYEYESIELEYEEPLRKNRAFCNDCGSQELRRIGWYTPDFVLANGTIIEAKGRFTAADRRKMLAVIEGHPDLRICMVFMRNNKLSKRSNTTYADWCEANNIEYTIDSINMEWLE